MDVGQSMYLLQLYCCCPMDSGLKITLTFKLVWSASVIKFKFNLLVEKFVLS